MERYGRTNAPLAASCISGMWALCLEDDNEDMVIDTGISLIVDALKTHPKDKKGILRIIRKIIFFN